MSASVKTQFWNSQNRNFTAKDKNGRGDVLPDTDETPLVEQIYFVLPFCDSGFLAQVNFNRKSKARSFLRGKETICVSCMFQDTWSLLHLFTFGSLSSYDMQQTAKSHNTKPCRIVWFEMCVHFSFQEKLGLLSSAELKVSNS